MVPLAHIHPTISSSNILQPPSPPAFRQSPSPPTNYKLQSVIGPLLTSLDSFIEARNNKLLFLCNVDDKVPLG